MEQPLIQNDIQDDEVSRNDDKVLREKVYRPMRWYFALTCQRWSIDENTSTAKLILYRLLQFVIACFALFYFVYTFGIFGSNKKPYNLGYSFFYYPITTVENAMWEFRWFVTCLLGILLTRGVWRETFEERLKNIKLGENRWNTVKYFSRALAFALLFMWALTVLGGLIEINFRLSRLNLALAIFIDALMTLLDRIIAFPLFFLFCVTMYILCCAVEEYRDDMETWGKDESTSEGTGSSSSGDRDKDRGGHEATFDATGKDNVISKAKVTDEAAKDENSARMRFREIKDAIRIAGLSFELYLMVHFLLLICTFFLGVCACFEQMEVRIAENCTMPLPFQIPRYTRFINFFGNLSLDSDYTVVGPSARSASMLTASHVVSFSQTEGKDANSGVNDTLGIKSVDAIRTKWLRKSMGSIAICSLVKTLESLLLYFLPISLMVRLQNQLRRVYEVIEDSNVDEHPLFNDVEVIRRMCKYVKTAHGLKIFGYTVPTFEAFMIAAFGTFFAVVIRQLLLHIHMKEG